KPSPWRPATPRSCRTSSANSPMLELALLISAIRSASKPAMMERFITSEGAAPEWRNERVPVPYRAALAEQEARNAAIAAGGAAELIWLLEHPPVYTAGTSAPAGELLDPRFDVVEAGRGGRYTYHGPGQRVGYVLLDLNRRGRDVRGLVHALEGWVIDTLGDLGVESWRAQ